MEYLPFNEAREITSKLNLKNQKEGIEFIQDFKIKWETGSNDSKSELRDKKNK